MAMTYTDLKLNVEEITEMDFKGSQLDMFTRQAEQKIYGFIKDLPILKKTYSISCKPTVGFSMPADALYVHSLVQKTGTDNLARKALVQKDYDWLLEAYPDTTETAPNSPVVKYYGIDANDSTNTSSSRMILRMAPKYDVTLQFVLEYQYHPRSIVDTDGDEEQPWLGTNYDTALLNAVLVEAARFMKAEPDILALYDQQYSLAMQQLMDVVNSRLNTDSFRPKAAPAQPLTVPAPAQPPQRQG
jgi:hypothetical protein